MSNLPQTPPQAFSSPASQSNSTGSPATSRSLLSSSPRESSTLLEREVDEWIQRFNVDPNTDPASLRDLVANWQRHSISQHQSNLREIRKLDESNAQYAREIQHLREAGDSDYLLKLEIQLENAVATIDQLSDESRSLDKANRQLKNELAQVIKKATSLEKSLQHSNSTRCDAHLDEIRELKAELRKVREENSDYYDQIVALQADIAGQQSQRDPTPMSSVDRSKLIKLEEELSLRETERVDIKRQVARIHDDLNQSLDARMKIDGRIFLDRTVFENLIHTAQAQDMKSQEIIREHEVTIQDLQQAVRRREEEIEELRHAIHDPRTSFNQPFESQISVTNLEREISCSNRVKELEDELYLVKEQLDIMSLQYNQLTTFQSMLLQENVLHDAALQSSLRKEQEMKWIIEDLQVKIEILFQQLEELSSRLYYGEDIEESKKTFMGAAKMALIDCGKMIMLANDMNEEKEALRAALRKKTPPGTPIKAIRTDNKVSSPREQSTGPFTEMDKEPTIVTVSQGPNLAIKPATPIYTVTSETQVDIVGKSWMDRLFDNLFVGLTEGNEDILWSTTTGNKNEGISSQKSAKKDNLINMVSCTVPTMGHKIWFEMLTFGRSYWTQIVVKDRTVDVRIDGPWWWSLIVQLLTLFLVGSICSSWWTIMAASAERELWMDANENTIKKYWDTSIWGAERDLLWRLLYGLGYV